MPALSAACTSLCRCSDDMPLHKLCNVLHPSISCCYPYHRLPSWQLVLLLAGSILLLYAAFSWSHPRLRAATSASKMHSHKCYEMDDKDRVKLLGAQNQVVNHTIATSNAWALDLFNLGLLAAHGFNQFRSNKHVPGTAGSRMMSRKLTQHGKTIN